MEKYKIRVVSAPGQSRELDVILSGDFAAVRHGQRLAKAGEKLEVYRRGECIFISEDVGCISSNPDAIAAQ